jgi:galactokinase
MDCSTLAREPIPIPDDVWVQVLFVTQRRLVGSPYAERVAQCAAAEEIVGPLRSASLASIDCIEDPEVRRRARHVICENQRVRHFASALRAGDLRGAGTLMYEGHESLRVDYETSTPNMDAAVADLASSSGVYGARMTGGGFGGCVVALTEPGAEIPGAWVVQAAGGAARV